MNDETDEIHDSIDTGPPLDDARVEMLKERRKVSFWNYMNLRIAIVNAFIVAVIGIASVYTTNLLTQQALASRVDIVEALQKEKVNNMVDKLNAIEKKLDDTVVTKEVLNLNLDPIRSELKDQREILNQIRIAIVRQPPPNFSPNVAPTP